MSNIEMGTCDWCLQEAPAQEVEEELWRFWKVISAEDPMVESYKKMCRECTIRYEAFSMYVERWKINASVVDGLSSGRHVKNDPLVGIEDHVIIEEETSEEGPSDRHLATAYGETVVEEMFVPGRSDRQNHSKWVDVHMRVGKKVLKCSLCNKTYRYSSSLTKHLWKHVSNDAFKCLHCNKSFKHSGQLKEHMCVHTGEKPFKCSICHEGFTLRGHLRRHLRSHAGEKDHTREKPFKCPICLKAFMSPDGLHKHVHVHAEEKPLKDSISNKFHLIWSGASKTPNE